MSIRYKLFGVFSVVIVLACGLAFFGIHGISNTGELVVRLYDGPLMGINHARSAHAGPNAARLEMSRATSFGESAPKDAVPKIEKLVSGVLEHLDVVRERVDNADVKTAREQAEAHVRDWLATGLTIIKPQPGGVT